MAAGTPVVSVAAMGTKDILVGCEGARISNGEIDDFCRKVVSLLSDKQSYNDTRQAAINYAREWDSTALAN